MKVQDLLSAKEGRLVTSWPTQRVAAAARLMAEESIGAMPVLDDARLVGILSERDVSRAVGTEEVIVGDLRVADLMTAKVVVCRPDDYLQTVMELMDRHHVRHLPVLDVAGRLLGMLSQRDVLAALLEATRAKSEEERERLLLEHVRRMKSGPPT